MTPDTASKFASFVLSEEETRMAAAVSPLFLAYLQNKIEAYASAIVDTELPFDPNPQNQIKAIMAHERLKNYVQAYQELLFELLENQQTSSQL